MLSSKFNELSQQVRIEFIALKKAFGSRRNQRQKNQLNLSTFRSGIRSRSLIRGKKEFRY